ANAPSAGLTVGVVAAVVICTTAIAWARRDPLTWITIGFGLFATTFSQEVWTHAGFARTLIPLYAMGFIATLGGMHARRAKHAPAPAGSVSERPSPELVASR